MATRRRLDLSITLHALFDNPELLLFAPAPTATRHHLETTNLKAILMAMHKVNLARPQRLSQAAFN